MKRYRNNFTLIELLVVLLIMGILMAVGASGLRSLTGSAGVTGTVRNLSSQLSLARSYAASRNRFIAVLLPDSNITGKITTSKTNNFTSNDTDKAKLFQQSRLCFVTYAAAGQYKFDSWVDDSRWTKWDPGIAVFIDQHAVQVTDVNGTGSKNSTAIVFANSGALISDDFPEIQVLRANFKYKSSGSQLIYSVKGEGVDESWKLTINPFTGGTSYEKLY